MPFEINVAERIRTAAIFWEGGDVGPLIERFREDAVLSLPTSDAEEGEDWIHGPQEIAQALLDFRKTHPDLRVRHAFVGRSFYIYVLLGRETFSMQIEPDLQDGRIRKAVLCPAIPMS